MSQNDAASAAAELHDEQVIQAALLGHLEYLRTAEDAHRRVAASLSSHPQAVGAQLSPITVAAAHRARSSSFGHRGEFLQQLIDFPPSGLPALSAQDMRTLQVPAHIGAAAVSDQLGSQIAQREDRSRMAAARPVARPAATNSRRSLQAEQGAARPGTESQGAAPAQTEQDRPSDWPSQSRPSFEDIIYGTGLHSRSSSGRGTASSGSATQ